jgi:chromosome partitioning protein
MKTLTFASRKGGSGKSLLAIHTAVVFENAGVNTSIIDLDPQKSAWDWGQDRGKENYPDVYAPKLDQLDRYLDDLRGNDVKLCVFDTPPHSDERSLAGLRLADLVVVPFRPSILDLRAMQDTVQLIGLAGKGAQAVLVMNAAPTRSSITADAMRAAEEMGLPISPSIIKDRVALTQAITAAQGVTEFEPSGKSAAEIIALRRFIAKRLKIRKGM